MPIFRRVFTQMPMYPFKIKAQVGLISAQATVGSKAKTSIIFALSRSLFTERVGTGTHGSRTKGILVDGRAEI
jgi:hypothetical protein